MEEKSFFEESGISVTNARFMVHEQTYAMSGITSVKAFRQDPSRAGPVVMALVGILIMFIGGGAIVIGLVLIGLAVLWWNALKSKFSVLLHSSSGEMKALTSEDEQYINRIINAINESIVHRG